MEANLKNYKILKSLFKSPIGLKQGLEILATASSIEEAVIKLKETGLKTKSSLC